MGVLPWVPVAAVIIGVLIFVGLSLVEALEAGSSG